LHDPIIIERRSRRQLRWLRILSALVAVLIGLEIWRIAAGL
jgi:ubiquinone biosynthesis protein